MSVSAFLAVLIFAFLVYRVAQTLDRVNTLMTNLLPTLQHVINAKLDPLLERTSKIKSVLENVEAITADLKPQIRPLTERVSGTLGEAEKTIRSVRELEQSRIVPMLDNARRITSNIEEITRQATVQTARVDTITHEAQEMVESVKRTVDLYNRTLARPAIVLASMAKGVKGAVGAFRRSHDDEEE